MNMDLRRIEAIRPDLGVGLAGDGSQLRKIGVFLDWGRRSDEEKDAERIQFSDSAVG